MKSLTQRCTSALLALMSTVFQTSVQANAPINNAPINNENHQLLNHTLPLLSSKGDVNLKEAYAGKVILAVNTASACGFTPQYEGLEKLYQKYQSQGLVVLGFPSNDFFQERKSDEEVATFCKINYGVTFPIFRKSSVRGKKANPFYKALNEATGKSPKWNFFKYLIGRDGNVIAVYTSKDVPLNSDLESAVKKALSE